MHEKDRDVLALALNGALKHLPDVQRIWVVSRRPIDWPDPRVVWSPEPSDGQLPSLAQLEDLWQSRNPRLTSRASWVYQQLLKLGAGAYIDGLSESYLALDADVIFLRPISFSLGGRVRFPYSRAAENNPPYRDAYRRLLGYDAAADFSLIAHHMLFDQALLGELWREVEARHQTPWYDAFVEAVDYSCASPISEMDLYGWWVLEHHPELAVHRQVHWRDVSAVPTALGRLVLARRWDFVAAHAWMRKPRWRRGMEIGRSAAYRLAVLLGLLRRPAVE